MTKTLREDGIQWSSPSTCTGVTHTFPQRSKGTATNTIKFQTYHFLPAFANIPLPEKAEYGSFLDQALLLGTGTSSVSPACLPTGPCLN